ncbi:homing endonuclease [Yersinia phage MHG19]|nr:homing endonuclease [Yersinia phage MHG19]
MYHFVYETTNLVNGKKYIGKHSSEKLDDDYLGSGIALRRAVDKYGSDSFKREILKQFDSSEEAFEYEAKLVTEEIVNDNNYYNMTTGGFGGNIIFTEDVKAKMSTSAKERIKRDGHHLQGSHRSKSTILKMVSTNKEKWRIDPTSHNRYGTTHSEESKRLMSEKAKARGISENSKRARTKAVTGSSWWNDGTINKRIRAGDTPPENFVKGRITPWQ